MSLRDVVVTDAEYRIEIAAAEQWKEKTTTYFIGDGGKILTKTFDNPAVYRFAGNEKYVRARVESSGGARAWTQPVFRKR